MCRIFVPHFRYIFSSHTTATTTACFSIYNTYRYPNICNNNEVINPTLKKQYSFFYTVYHLYCNSVTYTLPLTQPILSFLGTTSSKRYQHFYSQMDVTKFLLLLVLMEIADKN